MCQSFQKPDLVRVSPYAFHFVQVYKNIRQPPPRSDPPFSCSFHPPVIIINTIIILPAKDKTESRLSNAPIVNVNRRTTRLSWSHCYSIFWNSRVQISHLRLFVIFLSTSGQMGHAVASLVEALCYKQFESRMRWIFLIYLIFPALLLPWRRLSL
jgi:hypothetical protein